jgi:hypothetical protein
MVPLFPLFLGVLGALAFIHPARAIKMNAKAPRTPRKRETGRQKVLGREPGQ